MTEDFCKRTARKTQKLGYDPKEAARLAKFCYVSMMSVGGAMLLSVCQKRAQMLKVPESAFGHRLGPMPDPSPKSMAGIEDESLLCLPARARSDVLDRLNRWYGQEAEAASTPITDFSDIERRLPAL
ncbi:MAG: hypothetical protein A4E35_01950 [Methanoregula sp. PtaU1.Bin051]|nr:MAG: hypothetical protein A4E35_01950 [Methanoregula sp. PtaU1.Bin051]